MTYATRLDGNTADGGEPARDGSRQAARRRSPRPQHGERTTHEHARNTTVCVVDPDISTRSLLTALLSPLGCEVCSFASAEAFWVDELRHKAHCLIVEHDLPGMSGIELLERVRREAPELPVIILSQTGDVPTAVRAVRFGAMDFLQKPVAARKLVDKVTRVLDRASLTEDRPTGTA